MLDLFFMWDTGKDAMQLNAVWYEMFLCYECGRNYAFKVHSVMDDDGMWNPSARIPDSESEEFEYWYWVKRCPNCNGMNIDRLVDYGE